MNDCVGESFIVLAQKQKLQTNKQKKGQQITPEENVRLRVCDKCLLAR